jgi:DNA replication protein DnaC
MEVPMEKNQLNLFDVIGKVTPKTKEDEGFEFTESKSEKLCEYDICDGSGFIKDPDNTNAFKPCECQIKETMLAKLRNSHINQRFFGLNFDSFDDKTKSYLFKPLKIVEPFKPTTKVKLAMDEPKEQFYKRNYQIIEQKRSLQESLKSFCDTNLALLSNKETPVNLLLFGESGNGKTTFSSLIGTYFLENGRSVHFSTTQNFLDNAFDKKIDIKAMARSYDILILDEFFNEYHTENQFAKKKIKEILKLREEYGKITIFTSNGNPKDFSLLYGPSIMSLLNGTFFIFYLERETDGRVEKIYDRFQDFGY